MRLLALPDITNNIIYRNKWTGIFLESVRSTRSSVDQNVIVENGYCGIFCGSHTEALISNDIVPETRNSAFLSRPDPIKRASPATISTITAIHTTAMPSYSPTTFKNRRISWIQGTLHSTISCVRFRHAGARVKTAAIWPHDQQTAAAVVAKNQVELISESREVSENPDSAALEIKAPVILAGVNFSSASAILEPGSFPALDRIVASLRAYPDLQSGNRRSYR